MASIKSLLESLKALGITTSSGTETIAPLTGEETAAELASILKKAKAEPAVAKPTENASTTSNGGVIVWLKERAFISDTERVNAGIYQLEVVPSRWSKLPSNMLEVFDGEVPSRKLAQIARWAGMNPDGMDDETILEKVLLTEVKRFI